MPTATPHLDLDVLRSFATGVAMGSFAQAADRLGRSTSAVSAQLKKLESQTGTELLRKAGRGLELTEAGHTMLAYAHRLVYSHGLDLQDPAARTPIGAGCKVCERADCPQRAFPPLGRPLAVDEDRTSFVPYPVGG